MPSVSTKQHNAMEAAAHGNSTLGIPANVGKEFAAADTGKSFTKNLQHHGLARSDDHKRHPATSHYKGPSVAEARYRK